MQRIERDGEWEWEKLLAEWGKSGHPRLRAGIKRDQNWIDDDDESDTDITIPLLLLVHFTIITIQ